MQSTDIILWGAVIFGGYSLAKAGSLESVLPGAQKTVTQITTTPLKNLVVPVVAKAKGTALKNFADLTAQPGEKAMSAALGRSVWSIREAAAITGKPVSQLTLSDFLGIPDVPSVVYVSPTGQLSLTPTPGSVASEPGQSGAPATWTSPTGESNSWGGMTDAAIHDSFVATFGADNAQAAWESQHSAEVARNGF